MRVLRLVPLYALMALAAVYILAPLAWMALLSVMTQVEAISVPPHWIPEHPTLANYGAFFHPSTAQALVGADAITDMPYAIMNSIVVALGVTIANVVLASLAAYSFARLDFRFSAALMVAYLVARIVPAVAVMIPLYVVISRLGLLNQLTGLILVETGLTLPFSIWVLASYFRTIPRDLEDAARIDRCGWMKTMVRIFLPVALPGLVATAIFAFMESWGAFVYPLLFTDGGIHTTLPVIVANFVTDINVDYGLLATAGIFAALPPFLLVLFFQRWIVQGVAAGAVKG